MQPPDQQGRSTSSRPRYPDGGRHRVHRSAYGEREREKEINRFALWERSRLLRGTIMSNVGTSLPPASQQDHVEAIVSFAVRQLQNGSMSKSRGRTALTILYLIVLGFCFLTPVLYYFRLHWEERHAARLQQLENEIIRQSLRQANNNREESRAARRKSVEERRARMLQLFEPVRMVRRVVPRHTA